MTGIHLDDQPITFPPDWVAGAGEALFPEARRRQRRRRRIVGVLGVVLIACLAVIVALTDAGRHARVSSGGAGVPGISPRGEVTTLRLPGPLAVSPAGALYVADLARHEVLVRQRDGRFRVVAGDDRPGFSGDGGPAVRARLGIVSDLAFAPNGALYIADAGRIREVSRDGVIRTIAGDGRRSASGLVANGTLALRAALGSTRSITSSGSRLWIAFGPAGGLYISTGAQVLRLSGGRLDVVPAYIPAGPTKGNLNGRLDTFGPIALDARGDIDVAGVNGWSIWQIVHGIAHQLGTRELWSARQSGGNYSVLERAPGGAVYGEDGVLLLRIDRNQLVVSEKFGQQIAHEYFWLTYFALAPNGTTYADELPGGSAFEARQQLIAVPMAGNIKLLWEQAPSRRRG